MEPAGVDASSYGRCPPYTTRHRSLLVLSRTICPVFRRWLVCVVCIAIVAVGGSYLISYLTRWPAAEKINQPGPLIVISQPALSWDQVSETTTERRSPHGVD